MSEIRDILQRLIDEAIEVQTFPATVKEVDKTAQTCKVRPIDNSPELTSVRLRASIEDTEQGHIIYPVKDSTVLVTLINNNTSVAFVSFVSEVDEVLINLENNFKVASKNGEVQLNGKDKGALIVISELVKKINRLEDKHNSLVDTFNAHIHTGVTTGSSSSGTPGTPSGATIGTNTQESDIANDKVKHGDGQ